MQDERLLIAHVVYRFDVGGLENGVVNLLNRLPVDRFRHAVVALTEVTNFRTRVQREDVQYFSMHKPPGHGVKIWPSLYRLFRAVKPDIVHTRNLAPLEACFPAWLAGVPARVHGEHGWDVGDLGGSNRRHRIMRRFYRPFVSHYVALSGQIEAYLHQAIGVRPAAVTRIINGVDVRAFVPPGSARTSVPDSPFSDPALWVVGTVGRAAAVKDQAALVHSLARLQAASPDARRRLRLVIVGDGPLLGELRELARALNVAECVWLPGARGDIARVMAGLDVFALPSLAEGISNTLLEAMACARPVIATAVGGNVELVDDGVSGTLVPPSHPGALDAALMNYMSAPDVARQHGTAARLAAESLFSLDRMVADYAAVYERVAQRRLPKAAERPADRSSLSTRAGH